MITAIILAAGQSKRMGQPKMLLSWGNTTVLGQVIETFRRAGIDQMLVITGAARKQVDRIVTKYGVRVAHNESYNNGEMLSSLQCGLRALSRLADDRPFSSDAALICLGDQPQVQEGIIRAVVDRYLETNASLVVPSYQMRRGHPWLVSRTHWEEILQLNDPQTLRDFLNLHAFEIDYISVNDVSVISDMDTFEDYLKSRP